MLRKHYIFKKLAFGSKTEGVGSLHNYQEPYIYSVFTGLQSPLYLIVSCWKKIALLIKAGERLAQAS